MALELKEIMYELRLRSYLKTSGKSGLHIFLPISKLGNNVEPITYEKTRKFAKKIGNLLVARIPKKVTMEWNVKERADKVFFDHNQNSRAKTLASVFSVRPTPLATVSMPIKWDRLIDILPTDFTLLNVPEIINQETRGNKCSKIGKTFYLMELMDNNNDSLGRHETHFDRKKKKPLR